MRRAAIALPAFVLLLSFADAQKPDERVAPVKVEKGLQVEVWAAEPLLKNPVAFCFDEKGNAYVAETNRVNAGTPDTRSFMHWLDEDLACRTVADRVAMYKKHKYEGHEKNDDIVRKVWDSTGSGRADKSSVFSKGYNQPADGLGAGVLARKGQVYFTNIPDLYVLKDTKGENVADEKKSLFTGFGLSVQFVGHDLHGLRMGPDGKLYFSIGDRGFNVKTKEGKQLSYPNEGAVLRCEPDGRNLEVVHRGLRNPQEIAFDDHGNLFTYDNNCDSGDRARWVYIVEGGDSGWRGGYQYGTLYHPPGVPQGNRGPWNAEKIWHTQTDDRPAYALPPLLHFGNGPSGITHYPGIGLNEKYKDHFFACDFTSSPGNSVIWDVSMKPKGASFELNPPQPFVRGIVPTDCEFGPDGAFYWSDWVGGWGHPQKGRIFRLTDPEAMKNPAVAEAKKLLAEGMEKRTDEELAKLLEHPHSQVRFEAQYELADVASGRRKPADSQAIFENVVKQSKNRLARLHAIWGLGRLPSPQAFEHMNTLTAYAQDGDAELRAQVFKAMGSGRIVEKELEPVLLKGLTDGEPRVRYFAAIAFGRMLPEVLERLPASEQARFAPLFELLKANNDQDAYLRHAAVIGLTAATKNPVDLFNAWSLSRDKYDTPAVRLGVVLALRRHKSEKVAEFLADSDPKIVNEAAMAIHDERITGAYAKLAVMADRNGLANPVAYRSIAANHTLGAKENAERVAKIAANASFPDHIRIFALKLLATWSSPPRRDPITGLIHDLPKRDAAIATDALKPVVAGIFIGSDAVRNEAVAASSKLGMKEVGPLLLKVVKDNTATASGRADALYALAAVKDAGLSGAITYALGSDQPKLRAAGVILQTRGAPAAATPGLLKMIEDHTVSMPEKQAAFTLLGTAPESEDVDKALEKWLKVAAAGAEPPSFSLEVIEAVEARVKSKTKLHVPLKEAQASFNKVRSSRDDKLAAWSEALAGGDAEKGRAIFLNNNAVYCVRCHKLEGNGGEVGPALDGIAGGPMPKSRRYLLESIALPSAQIAKGFETAVLTLVDGRVVSGIVKEETKKQVKLLTAEAKELVIPAEDIESRRTGPSAMPDDLHKKLSRRELRDVVEFLVSLKQEAKR
ncbi:MAG: PVC-type heme-binding CxxCH protein [Gemmataceae bacterium]